LSYPGGLGFNSAGDLFAAARYGDAITEFTPEGAQSTFASGLENPAFLAFQTVSVPDDSSTLALLAVAAATLLARRFKLTTQLIPDVVRSNFKEPSRGTAFVALKYLAKL
jgi:hypothetical protein